MRRKVWLEIEGLAAQRAALCMAVPSCMRTGCGFLYSKKERNFMMETKVALLGIIVENMASIPQLNEILHEYSGYIIGRMGIPYREKNVNIISVAVDAPPDVVNALSGKIGRLNGISAKTISPRVSGAGGGDV